MAGEQHRVARALGEAAGSSPRSRPGGSRGPRGSGRRRSSPRGPGASRRRSACRPRSAGAPPIRSITRSCRKRSSLTCSGSGMSPTSSRNRVPPCASSILPGVRLDRAGEGAALVAEQLGLEQVLGDGGAVDGDELALARRSSRGPRGPAVPCRCRCAPSSITDTSAVATRSIVLRDLQHLRAPVIIEPSTVAPPPACFEPAVLGLDLVQGGRRGDDQAELVDVDRLAVEIIGAERDRLERAFAGAVAGATMTLVSGFRRRISSASRSPRSCRRDRAAGRGRA